MPVAQKMIHHGEYVVRDAAPTLVPIDHDRDLVDALDVDVGS
ncbi:hypothetical protein L810_6893 [Burkholderia sp. AU4i]|nr:hypothetical protein L810_6893 [Burkholderia sp. AU4i]